MAGDASREAGLGGTALLHPPGPSSLEGKGNSFAVMWNLSPALEMGRAGMKGGQGVPGGGG